ncbi:MAG: aldehyde dehydrogenase family protein, partial [Leptospiraceae bacterium]|nr:aldehyde dehydrogenase family protein [Leptospiraceae bacterium]
MEPKEFLRKLGLKSKNDGTWTGREAIKGSARSIKSYSPVDGALIGSVSITTRDQYDQVIAKAQEAFTHWRSVPAPKRGEIIRQY